MCIKEETKESYFNIWRHLLWYRLEATTLNRSGARQAMEMHDVDRSKDAGAVAAYRAPAPSEGGRFHWLETFTQASKDSTFSTEATNLNLYTIPRMLCWQFI